MSSHRLTLAVLSALFLFIFSASAAFAASEVPATDLSLGSRGPSVMALQQHLISENAGSAATALAKAGATGYFGPMTRAAVIEFQTKNKIVPARGYFGALTRARLIEHNAVKPAPTFSGKIEAVDTACFADGVCSVTIGGKKIIIVAGMRIMPLPPVGSLRGVASIGDLENNIGTVARVYAATSTDEGYDYTLYGSTKYYVEVEPKPVVVPNNGRISVAGTITCLPAKDPSKPVIAMCAYGLKADDGNYYALSLKSGMELSTYDDGAQKVHVRGTFTRGENPPWNSVGTIVVREINAHDKR